MRTLNTFALQIQRGEDHQPSRFSVVLSTAARDADGVMRLSQQHDLGRTGGRDQRAPGRAGRAESGCAESVHGSRDMREEAAKPHRLPISALSVATSQMSSVGSPLAALNWRNAFRESMPQMPSGE